MNGDFLIGARAVGGDARFQAVDPATDALIEPGFAISSEADVAEACRLADAAFDAFREVAPEARAVFLETIATNLQDRGDALIARAMQESGLPRARLTGELGRTTGQLRLFAGIVREGHWAGIVFDTPLPERQPLARPDLRQRRIAIGPVAVFGASNFPLAFSVAGGDTASALAAGCPVVVKGHPAHPGTSLISGEAIRDAVAACGLPEGVFSLVQGPSNALGAALVADPRIKAVGFTGSRAGGLALIEIAQRRGEPIPVYAEMSSVNPVVLLPAALAARAEPLAQAYVGSLTMGAGQFCTNPGVVLAVAGADLDRFIAAVADALPASPPQVMLTHGIHQAYERGVAALNDAGASTLLARGSEASGCNQAQAAVFVTDAAALASNAALTAEVFGSASLIVRCVDLAEVAATLSAMEGQLTATLHLDAGDHDAAAALVPILERRVGRIVVNGWPTGVEVSYAMVHGGPYPATSDARTTSVGASAIDRFLRPVCYQGLPEAVLPPMLRDADPYAVPRRVVE